MTIRGALEDYGFVKPYSCCLYLLFTKDAHIPKALPIVPYEERDLEKRFGECYLQYKGTVPRRVGKFTGSSVPLAS